MGYISERLASLRHALSGLKRMHLEEDNFKIHTHAAIITVVAGYFLNIHKTEWIIIFLCIAAVLVAEIFNTALEKLCDMVNPETHPQIKYIKDISAGAVLLASVASAIIGLMIFVPKFF